MINFVYSYGTTPLDPYEKLGLIPKHITSQYELNEMEQENILQGEIWAFSRKKSNILTVDFIKLLHKKMFGKTWKWAGEFRKSNKNIGIDWPLVYIELKALLSDIEYQINNNVYPLKEIAARFHHKLVFIHCFANGNGRHARLMTDILLVNQGSRRFNWGKNKITNNNVDIRKLYISSLREADNHNYRSLIDFVD
jgi:Fic-DOC domain mobile mystery protein B